MTDITVRKHESGASLAPIDARTALESGMHPPLRAECISCRHLDFSGDQDDDYLYNTCCDLPQLIFSSQAMRYAEVDGDSV